MTYLGPETQEAALEEHPGEVGDGDGGPDEGDVVRSPGESAVHDGDGVDLADPLPLGEHLTNTPEDEDDGETERETEEGLGVLAADTPNLLGTDGTPEDGGGEEGVDTGAGHLELGVGGADAGDAGHLELQDTEAHEGGDEGRDHLGPEGEAGGDLDVPN